MSIFEKKKRPRKLKDIDVEEISLVDHAATQKSFFIVKKEGLGIVDRIENFIPAEDPEREILKKIGGAFPADLRAELEKNLDTLIEYQNDLTPDLQAAAPELVALGLGSAAQGPDEAIGPALEEIKKVAAEWEEDMNDALKSALIYFYKMAEDGLEGFEYEAEDFAEEDEEDEDEEAPIFPSLMRIPEKETVAEGGARRFIGKSIFKDPDEDPDDEKLTDKERIKKLEAQLKERSKPRSHQLPSDDLEGIEKVDEGEFFWPSLCSGE